MRRGSARGVHVYGRRPPFTQAIAAVSAGPPIGHLVPPPCDTRPDGFITKGLLNGKPGLEKATAQA
jgi:hypothetical protein